MTRAERTGALWQWLLLASVLGILLGLLAARWADGRGAPPPWRGVIWQVTDGDTLVVRRPPQERVRIRLAGIDAPETAQPCGAEAKAHLAGLAPQGARVAVQPLGIWTHGRRVAWVAARPGNAPEADLSLAMVRAGYAYRYPGQPCHPLCEPLAAAEAAAREARLGCWAAGAPERPWDYRRRRAGR